HWSVLQWGIPSGQGECRQGLSALIAALDGTAAVFAMLRALIQHVAALQAPPGFSPGVFRGLTAVLAVGTLGAQTAPVGSDVDDLVSARPSVGRQCPVLIPRQ